MKEVYNLYFLCEYILVTRASDLMAAHDPQSCAKEKSSGVEIVASNEVGDDGIREVGVKTYHKSGQSPCELKAKLEWTSIIAVRKLRETLEN